MRRGKAVMRYIRAKKKATKSVDFIALVPHTRVELVIYCVRGSCPGPLDECGVPFCGDFSLEIGCKDTNFFLVDKFLNEFFCHIVWLLLVISKLKN